MHVQLLLGPWAALNCNDLLIERHPSTCSARGQGKGKSSTAMHFLIGSSRLREKVCEVHQRVLYAVALLVVGGQTAGSWESTAISEADDKKIAGR